MDTARDLYLDLMMKSLTDWLYDQFDIPVRVEGRDWPARAHTMIGLKRLANVRECVEGVLADNVPGDLIETGVWRGGTTIFIYESTIQALESLYDKLSAGGYVIVDDYGNVAACRQEVHDFRAQRGITIRSSPSIGQAFTGGEHNLGPRTGKSALLTSSAIAESCRFRRGLAVYGG